MIVEVIIPVLDLAEATEFYTETVGLTYVGRAVSNDEPLAVLVAGQTRVVLIEGEGTTRIAWQTENATAAGRQLVLRGVAPQAPATPGSGGVVLPFRDPWGNEMAFWEPERGEDAK